MFVVAKLKGRNGSVQKMSFTLNETMFPNVRINELDSNSIPYSSTAAAGDFEWLVINNLSTKPYSLDILTTQKTSVDYNDLNKEDITKVEFIAEINSTHIFFQKITKASFLKKAFISFSNSFEFKRDEQLLQINKIPDAIYDKETDNLYFKNLFNISHIFPDITNEYRTATEGEVKAFLENTIFSLDEKFSIQKVKIPNRKKIAIVKDKLESMSETDKGNLFDYVKEYCADIKIKNNTFEIQNEGDLRNVLYGLEEKFYTTNISKQKRIANSVVIID